MAPRKCCVAGCQSIEGSSISLFGLPEPNSARFEKYLKFINLPTLEDCAKLGSFCHSNKLRKKFRVCQLHFDKKFLNMSKSTPRLMGEAVPSLHPPGTSSNHSSQQQKLISSPSQRPISPSSIPPTLPSDHLRSIVPVSDPSSPGISSSSNMRTLITSDDLQPSPPRPAKSGRTARKRLLLMNSLGISRRNVTPRMYSMLEKNVHEMRKIRKELVQTKQRLRKIKNKKNKMAH